MNAIIFDFEVIKEALRNLHVSDPKQDKEAYCTACENGGWEGYFTPTGGGPNFRICEECGNPEEYPRP